MERAAQKEQFKGRIVKGNRETGPLIVVPSRSRTEGTGQGRIIKGNWVPHSFKEAGEAGLQCGAT